MDIKKIKILVVSLFSVVLFGCSISTPVMVSGKYEGLANLNPKKGTVYIYRDDSYFGATNQYDVMVDGVLMGSLPRASFFTVDLDPGEHRIEPRTLPDFKLGKGSSITTEKGKTYCMKLKVNFCFGCKSADIDQVDKALCEREMKSSEKVRLEKPGK